MSSENHLEFHNPQSLMAVGNRLPTADETSIYWNDPASGDEDTGGFEFQGDEYDEIDEFKAVYNSSNGDLFGVVTDDYQIINPPEFIGPLVEQIKKRDRTDCEGFVNVYNGGASGYGELLFDTGAIWPPDRTRSDDPVRCGMTFRYSHDGGISVRASGFAQDGLCSNTMRRVTDAVYVKHAGDVDERVDWHAEWDTVLSQLGVFSETLATVIEGAMEFQIFDLGDHEFGDEWVDATDPQEAIEEVASPVGVTERQIRGLHGFYDYLGFPNYLSLSSVDRLAWRMSQRADPRIVSAWDAYSALTYALSHDARFDAGSGTDDRYHRIASDVLANPQKALTDAQAGLRDRLAVDDEQETFGVEATVGEAVAVYEEREEQMRGAMEGDG